jgi:hypothetical protein
LAVTVATRNKAFQVIAQLLDGAEAKEEIAQDGFAHGVLLA